MENSKTILKKFEAFDKETSTAINNFIDSLVGQYKPENKINSGTYLQRVNMLFPHDFVQDPAYCPTYNGLVLGGNDGNAQHKPKETWRYMSPSTVYKLR